MNGVSNILFVLKWFFFDFTYILWYISFMYLTELEEWFAIFICLCIVVGFILSTIHNIKETISEEKKKFKKQRKEEDKVKELIKYLDTKTELINTVVSAQKKLKKKKKK